MCVINLRKLRINSTQKDREPRLTMKSSVENCITLKLTSEVSLTRLSSIEKDKKKIWKDFIDPNSRKLKTKEYNKPKQKIKN